MKSFGGENRWIGEVAVLAPSYCSLGDLFVPALN